MNTVLYANPEEKKKKEKVSKSLLWLAIVAMSMAFAALTSYYVVARGKGNWMVFELPRMFWFSTAVIMLSSVSMNWALIQVKKNSRSGLKIALLITLLLGLGFAYSQFRAWNELYANSIVFAGKYSYVSGSILYFITAFHLLHLAGGIMALLVTLLKSFFGKYSPENYLGVKLCAIFWHFLDILWLYLFLFLYFMR